jgi:O-antigen/teichoic acid export membrane protein
MIRRLLSETMIYGMGQVSQQLLALVTLPIFARILTPADYGMIETLATLTAVVGIVASLQFTTGIQRRYFDYAATQVQERQRVIVTALATVALTDLLLLALSGPWCESIMRYFQGAPGSGRLLFISLAGSFAAILLSLCQEVHRLHRRPWAYSLIALSGAVIWTVCGLYYVFWAKAGVWGYVWGGTLANLVTLAVGLVSIRADLGRTFSRLDLREMLAIALPWIPTAASAWLMGLADRMVMNHWVGLADIGYYGVGQKCTRLISIVIMAFGAAWSPFVLSLFAEDPDQEKRVRAAITPFLFAALSLPAVILTGIAPEVIRLLASETFLPAAAVVAPLCLGMVGYGMTQTTCIGISLAKQTRYFAFYSMVSGILNVVLNLLLVPTWGTAGSAWATAISFVVLNVLYYRKSQQLHPTPFAAHRLIIMSALTTVTVTVLGYVQPLGWRLVGVAAFLPLVYLLGAVDRQQVRAYVQQGWGSVRPWLSGAR